MDKTVYVVTADGIKDGWGSVVYLIGVYNTEEQAQKVCKENEDWGAEVTEITANTTYSLRQNEDGNYLNEHYLGGYEE